MLITTNEDAPRKMVYITDVRHREAIYRTIGEYTQVIYPVSTGLVVQALARPEWLVEIDGTKSEFLNVTCGVPQGSILGPLLFLCYVNDMSISVNCKLLLYADDSALMVSGKDPSVIAQTLSNELESCRHWLIDNKLSLHLGKTESLIFGSRRRLKKVKEFNVMCNGQSIEEAKSVKYLGVTLDQCLSGETLANNTIKKAGSRIKFLWRHSNSLNEKSRRTLCSALIQCHLDYCCSSWFSGLTQKLKSKLQVIQNKMVRFILDLGPMTHIGQRELDQVGFLNIHDRVKQLKLGHVHNISQGKCPPYLRTGFTYISEHHLHGTRDSLHNFVVPRVNGPGSKTFFYTAIKDWNMLPNQIKSIKNKPSFKKQVKKHLSMQANSVESNIYLY